MDILLIINYQLQIEYNDGLPSQICLKCINKIMLAYSFKRECEKSEKILLNYISETTNQTEILDCSDGESSENIVKNEEKYMCRKCNKNYATYSSLKRHEITKHAYTETNNVEKKIPEGNALVKCDWCEYVFVNEFTLKKHISSKHKNKELKSFQVDEQKWVNIENGETKTTAKCSFCNYVFANEDHLKKHLLAKHLNYEYDSSQTDMQGFCNFCGIQSKNIQLHINEHYKHLYCTNCSLKFENVGNFEKHVKQNVCKKNTSYLCSICGKIFNQLSNFRIHSLVHGKQYSCTICDRSFTTPSILNLHVKTHTHGHPHVSEMCAQSFKQASELTIHKLIHSNERPLQCNICCKRFNTVDKLNCHKRIHTGEQPYSCKICNKKFALAGALRKHSLTHMREKKHTCNLCRKQFSQTSTLLEHLKSHE